MKEEVKRSYKPRTEVHVRLSETYFDEDKLHELLDGLGRAPKQQSLLLKYLELAGAGTLSGCVIRRCWRRWGGKP